MPLQIQENINPVSAWALWYIQESEEELLSQIHLSLQEKKELEQLKGQTRKLEWISSRLLLKKLAHKFHLPDAQVVKDPYGKPLLKGLDVHISLSHSYPYAAAIIHAQKPVGIDIEHSREQLITIRHKFLNTEELECAGNLLPKLCVYWTAKEALYKLYGRRGLALKEHILVGPFELAHSGILHCQLLTEQVKESYTLHYRQFNEVHVCYSL